MNMKKNVAAAIVGALSIWATGPAKAQNVTWVQNANFALTAEVQVSDGVVKKFGINSKTLIQYLKGATNTGVGNIDTVTTNGFVVVTNNPFLPTNSDALSFPTTFTLTNYFVTVGSSTFTNRVQFTNDLDFIETSTDPVTYQFSNIVNLDPSLTGGTNANAVLFTILPNATNILAVWDNTVTNATVFTLFDITETITEGTVTNGVPPEFISKNPRLIVKSAPNSQDFSWFIRDGTAKDFVDYDVTTFFNYNRLNEVSQTRGTGFADFLDLSIDFNLDPSASGIGTTFGTEANGHQTRSAVAKQDGLFVKGPTAICVGSGTAAPPNSAFTGSGKPLPTGAMVINGRFSASGGKIEATP
jgi:hypothetical protein